MPYLIHETADSGDEYIHDGNPRSRTYLHYDSFWNKYYRCEAGNGLDVHIPIETTKSEFEKALKEVEEQKV